MYDSVFLQLEPTCPFCQYRLAIGSAAADMAFDPTEICLRDHD
jgi:hypothetical protein